MIISPAQCRAARAMTRLTISQLADVAEVSVGAIANFEKEETNLQKANMKIIVMEFEKLGIEFLDNGVRLIEKG